MRHGGIIFIIILFVLITYTGFKINQLSAGRQRFWLSWLFSLSLFVVMIGWQFLYRNKGFASNKEMISVMAWLGSCVLGIWATFIIFSLPYDIISLALLLMRKMIHASPMDHQRREVFTRYVPAGILGASIVIMGKGMKTALSGPQIKKIEISILNLDDNLNGLKIVQISDLHVSPLIGKSYVENVVRLALSLDADMIAVTGDLADGSPTELKESMEPLSKLKAPLGTFYITGNHEYYWNADEWISAGKTMGFTPLINESKILSFKGSEFLLGGVTDTSSYQFSPYLKSDPQAAMGTRKDFSLKLLLAHRPESFIEAEKAGWDVQLSGHTHAGQFFPFNILMPFAHKHYRGLDRVGNLWLYVNAGTGYWGPPHRFTVPSEITLITIKKSTPS